MDLDSDGNNHNQFEQRKKKITMKFMTALQSDFSYER